MLWVQLSWTICLFGAELTYTSQNLEEFAFRAEPDDISHRYRLLLSAILLSRICRREDMEEQPATAFQLKMETGIPAPVVSDLLYKMTQAGILRQSYSSLKDEEAVYTALQPIDKITLDYSTVTLYGTEAVLDEIDGIFIDLDISSISKNTIFSTALTAPSGISKMSVTRVNMEIVVGPAVSKVIEKVETQFVNNTSTYVFAPVNSSDVYMNILVTGTQANIDSVNATNVFPELDLSNIQPGNMSVPIRVTGNNKYVTYQLEDGRTEIEIVVKEQ